MAKALAFLLAISFVATGCSDAPDREGAASAASPANEAQDDLCEAPDLDGVSLNNDDGAGGVSAISFAIVNVSSSTCEFVLSTASILTRTGDLRELNISGEGGHFPLHQLDPVIAAGERLLGRLEYVVDCPGGSLSLEAVAVALVLGIGERFIVLTLPDIESCTPGVVVAGAVPPGSPETD